MSGYDYFDSDGHLTNFALQELVGGDPDELTRLELAEHLSFCDPCTERYTQLLCGGVLLEPEAPAAPPVLQRIRRQARVIFLNRYVVAGVAASFAMFFWVNGSFQYTAPRSDRNLLTGLSQITAIVTQKTAEFSSDFTAGIQDFFINFDPKGVFQNEKK